MSTSGIRALIIATFVFASLFAWALDRLAPESAPVARGAAYAQGRGCLACHGNSEARLGGVAGGKCSNSYELAGHPQYAVECGDALAYFEVIRLRRTFDDRARTRFANTLAAGEYLARKYHCFQCHGQLGQGGFKNARSLKGYVPGYFGSDFRRLTRDADPASVRQWIFEGMDSAILTEPLTGWIATYFFDRQAVSMPSYNSLSSVEIDILTGYVIALNKFGPMNAKSVRGYRQMQKSANEVVSIDGKIRPGARPD